MGTETTISYVRHSFNPWLGCEQKSPGCDNCFAKGWAKMAGRPHLWEGVRERTRPATWKKPLDWNAAATVAGERRRVLCGTLCDVFEDRDDLLTWRGELFDLIARTPNLDWMLLTKSPANWLFLPNVDGRCWPNVWLGVTIEDQERLADRMFFVETASMTGWRTWVSAEPMLEPLDFGDAIRFVDWMVIGGESVGARLCDLSGVRRLLRACNDNGVPAYVKQLGRRWARSVGAKSRDGEDPAEWPAEFRVREEPRLAA